MVYSLDRKRKNFSKPLEFQLSELRRRIRSLIAKFFQYISLVWPYVANHIHCFESQIREKHKHKQIMNSKQKSIQSILSGVKLIVSGLLSLPAIKRK